jgi:hypothetical protein
MKKALREPFNIKTFVEFLRHATGQPRPRWEESVTRYVQNAISEHGDLEGMDMTDEKNFPRALQAFNQMVRIRESAKSGQRARQRNTAETRQLSYEGTCRY